MEELLISIFSILQITLIDIVLSGDNMGVIALAVRNLPKTQARLANFIGVCGALIMRVIFASLITTLLMIQWLPIKLFGGILLLKITWNLLTMKEGEHVNESGSKTSFWFAVYNIIIADATMSLDNVLAIGGIAEGNIVMIVFGILLNIPIIFFGSQLVGQLIEKYSITIYIGSGVLVHTALRMILEDRLIAPHIFSSFTAVFPWTVATLVIFYGVYITRNRTQLFK